MFLNQTGRRVGDAIGVESQHLDLKTLEIHIPKTKNGDPFTAYITTELAERLSRLPERNGKVFGYNSRSAIRSALKHACKEANIEYLGTHQIGRHSFATKLNAAKWGSKAIAEAMGAKSVRLVAEIYEHPEDAPVKAAKIMGKES